MRTVIVLATPGTIFETSTVPREHDRDPIPVPTVVSEPRFGSVTVLELRQKDTIFKKNKKIISRSRATAARLPHDRRTAVAWLLVSTVRSSHTLCGDHAGIHATNRGTYREICGSMCAASLDRSRWVLAGRFGIPLRMCLDSHARHMRHLLPHTGGRAMHACARHMQHSTPHATESMCGALAAPLLPAGSLDRGAR
ncbi:hypothetical protein F511_05661 [Dorcoceras hygrometricum]|uniref:Uncharacterized protein n=1 Tax=Dorcoceras hygrometricum TaxID=472368 RepID=A0A2Z7C0J8_9LAMI|nr:hypothetical protein F511_05661 [Dorcoceras hygrometricum]